MAGIGWTVRTSKEPTKKEDFAFGPANSDAEWLMTETCSAQFRISDRRLATEINALKWVSILPSRLASSTSQPNFHAS